MRYYHLNRWQMDAYKNKVTNHMSIKNNKPHGTIWGKWFIGNLDEPGGFIICSEKFYHKNFIAVHEKTHTDGDIYFYERYNDFKNLNYTERIYDPTLEPNRDNQQSAIDQILTVYDKKKYARVLLSGKPNIGKSMIAVYLCKTLIKKYKLVSFCDTWNPTTPNNDFSSLYKRTDASATNPLVVLVDEVDVIIMRIMQVIPEHREMAIPVRDKTSWNLFLDRFDRQLYPHVILIFTTNMPFEFFDNIDTSLMREGRIDLRVQLE